MGQVVPDRSAECLFLGSRQALLASTKSFARPRLYLNKNEGVAGTNHPVDLASSYSEVAGNDGVASSNEVLLRDLLAVVSGHT